jgi:signal transduction histidine kinase
MRPTDYLPWRRVTGDSGTVPIGPAMTTLRSVIARLASMVRGAGIVYIAVQAAIWHSFYTADSWRLAGPVVAMAWAAAVTAYLWRRWPAPFFACVDTAVYLALALGAQWCLPPAVRGYAFSWLFIVMSCQLIVPAWYAPAPLSVPLGLAALAAYWVGAEQIAGTGTGKATETAILLTMVVGIHFYGRRELYARAAAADAALDQADRDASEQYVILSRTIERREHERLLHDTILNTLTALARADGDDVAEAVSLCRQDVALIEEALGAPGDPDAGRGDLVRGVRAVAAEMRARGLNVHVEIAGSGPPGIPAAVATAISNAAREALSNVAEHAETGDAWVEISHEQGGVRVTVRDRGRGFDLARVDRTRLGLRRSIAERVDDCGGRASIWSAPHQGTVVRMSWPAPAEPALGGLPW